MHYERHVADESEARGWFQSCLTALAAIVLQVAASGVPGTVLGLSTTIAITMLMVFGSVYFGLRLRRLASDRPRLLRVVEGGRAAR